MIGLVLQGGGAKGSYHIGVWKAIRELGMEIGAVTGTSIGALNGVMIAQDKFDEVYELWYNIRPGQLFEVESELYEKYLDTEKNVDNFGIYFKQLRTLFREGGMDISPLKQLIERQVDEAAVRRSSVAFGLVTVDLTDLEPLELFIEDIPEGKLHDYLLGSAHLPIFKMDRVDGKWLVDGMFYDNQPVKLLLRRPGIDTVILVESKGLGVHQKVDLSGLTVHRIQPSGDTGRTLDLTREQARNNLQMGYYDALRHFQGHLGLRYCIRDFDEEQILKALYNMRYERIERVTRALGIRPVESRRQIFEEVIPALAKMLKVPEVTDYREFFVEVIESVAAYLEIDRFKVYDFDELIEEVRRRLEHNENRAVKENRRLIDRLLKQGNLIIGNLKQEIVVEVMSALLTEAGEDDAL